MNNQDHKEETVCIASRGNEPNLRRESGMTAVERIKQREVRERKRQIDEMRKAARFRIY